MARGTDAAASTAGGAGSSSWLLFAGGVVIGGAAAAGAAYAVAAHFLERERARAAAAAGAAAEERRWARVATRITLLRTPNTVLSGATPGQMPLRLKRGFPAHEQFVRAPTAALQRRRSSD